MAVDLGPLSGRLARRRKLSRLSPGYRSSRSSRSSRTTLGPLSDHYRRGHSRSYRTATLGAIGAIGLVACSSTLGALGALGLLSEYYRTVWEPTTTMLASCQDALREHESTRGCEYTPPELIVFEQKHPRRMGARAASTWRLVPPQSQKPEKHILALLWPRTAMTIHLSPEQVCHGPPRLGQIPLMLL